MAPYSPLASPWLNQQLPALAIAFAEPAMREALQDALCGVPPRRYVVEHCELDQATYNSDQSCSLRYLLRMRDTERGGEQTVLVSGDLFASDAACRAAYHALQQLAATGAGQRPAFAPFVAPVALLPALRMVVRVFPLDAEMPMLLATMDDATMLGVLRDAVPAARSQQLVLEECRAELVDYGRHYRCTLRYRVQGHTDAGEAQSLVVYGKVTADGSGALAGPLSTALREHIARSGGDPVRIPQTFAWLPELHLSLLEAIPGEARVGDALKARLKGTAEPGGTYALEGLLDRSAHIAGLVHTSGLELGPRRTLGDELTRLEQRVDALEPTAPELGSRLKRRIKQLAPFAAGAMALVLSHGDFTAGQLLFDGANSGLIDFDSICQAEPALDLAQLLVYMQLGATKQLSGAPNAHGVMDAVTDRVLRSYRATAGLSQADVDQLEQRVNVYRVVSLLRRALQSFYKFKPKRVEQALELIDATADALPAAGQVRTVAAPATPRTESLLALAALPHWLRAALDTGRLHDALERHVPELATGTQALAGCAVKRLLLSDTGERWSGTYTVTVRDPQTGERQRIVLRGTLTPPRLDDPTAEPPGTNGIALGAPGWRCRLPELGLTLTAEPPDANLLIMPQLTEPEPARALLQAALTARGGEWADCRIVDCAPEVLSYKPGSRAVIRYRLAYASERGNGRSWPEDVIAKTYRKASKAENAYTGMLALWESPLATSAGVRIAEPLAFVAEHKLLVQAALPAEQTLEELLVAALRTGSALTEEVVQRTRQAAVGLAALHQSGVTHGATLALDERISELPQLLARLMVPVPEVERQFRPLISWLEAAAADHADPPVPTHGTFNPEQVLLGGSAVGIIDFDDMCMAEPAMDVGLFCSAIKDTGMNIGDAAFFASRAARLARLRELDVLCDVFVDEYRAHAPLSRRRVLLWQALDALRNCLHFWIKVKPAEPDTPMLVLAQLQRDLG